MTRRLPSEAFEYYFSLGVDRSYEAVADHYGVSKVTVTRRAKREHWQERLRELERKARETSQKKALDEMEAVRERHVKAARLLQAKALEALRNMPPEKAVKAAGALNIAWKHELLVLGEPTDRQATVEEITKREMSRWLVVDDSEEDEDADEDRGAQPTAG